MVRYYCLGSPTLLTKALATALHGAGGWQQAANPSGAELVILDQNSQAITGDSLRFCHQGIGGCSKRVIVIAHQLEGSFPPSPWLLVIHPVTSNPAETIWWANLEYKHQPLPECPTVNECESLIVKIYGAIAPAGHHAATWNNILALYINLEEESEGYDFHEHNAAKRYSDLLNTQEGIDELKLRRFRQICEDLRRSLVNRVLDPDHRRHILFIDDHADEFRDSLQLIVRSFLPEYELICAPVSQKCVEELRKFQSWASVEEYAARLWDWSPEEWKRTASSLKELLRMTRFILIDQLFATADGYHLLGPSITRALSRVCRDLRGPKEREDAIPDIIAVSRAEDAGVIQEALRAGAIDYVVKQRVLGLPSVLARVQRMSAEAEGGHATFKAMAQLPNETVGLLKTIRIPRVDFHRAEDPDIFNKRIAQQVRTPGLLEVATLLTVLPKPDIHVHLGSCMSPEFLVVASFVGLLKHSRAELQGNGFEALVALLNAIQERVDISFELSMPFKDERNTKPSSKTVLRSLAEDCEVRSPLQSLAEPVRAVLIEWLDSNDELLRSVLHEELHIPDFLDLRQAQAKLKSTSDIALGFFALKHSRGVGGWWTDANIIRAYILTLANRYGALGESRLTMSGLSDTVGFNFLELFSSSKAGSIADQPHEESANAGATGGGARDGLWHAWNSCGRSFYSIDGEWSIRRWREQGWSWRG